MNVFRNIFTIAHFESRTLFRSWFFRIFALIGIVILTIFNLVALLNDGSRWWIRSISTIMPYINMIILNIAQGIIASFLASDFLKRDRKLDTSEVIYIRSMSNGEYVLGKSLGILYVFMALNALILSIALTINFLFEDVTVNILGYIIYPIIMSLPTLVFVLGFAYILMMIFKNQAVTFVILLGFLAASLFYLSDKYNYAFDFLGFSYPMVISDIVGFSDLAGVLIQRGYFFLFGMGLIFLCVVLLNRLEQSKVMRLAATVLTIASLGGGLFLLNLHFSTYSNNNNLREQMLTLNDEYADSDDVLIYDHNISLDHQGDKISSISEVTLKNVLTKNSSPVFRLNPGLSISSMKWKGQEITFDRKLQIVIPKLEIKPGEEGKLTFEYSGHIDEAIAYLDADEKFFETNRRNAIYNVNKNFAFIKDNYVLLTPEVVWYPIQGIAYSRKNGILNAPDFINYNLKVKTDDGLVPVSQGLRKGEKGDYEFSVENRLKDISLAIGNYKEDSITVDSITYSILYIDGHNYYERHFTNVKDTLPTIIRELKDDFERPLMTNYPFNKFSIVEVPVQFITFPKRHTIAREVSPPQMVFMPEKGTGIRVADFDQRLRRMKEQSKGRGRSRTDTEMEVDIFKAFVNETIASKDNTGFFGNQTFRTNYSIFPNYYTHINYFHYKEWPYFNRLFEAYMFDLINTKVNRPWWFNLDQNTGNASIALQQASINELLANTKQDIFRDVVQTKSNFVFTMLKGKAGEGNFEKILTETLFRNKFSVIDFEEFKKNYDSISNLESPIDIKNIIERNENPAFLSSLKSFRAFKEGDYTKFYVSVEVSNTEEIDGIINISINLGGDRRGGFRGRGNNQETVIEELIEVGAKETITFNKVLDSEPRSITIGTLLSKNLPLDITHNLIEPEEVNFSLKDTVLVSEFRKGTTEEGVLIVDNEEEDGFAIVNAEADTPLRSMLLSLSGDQEEEEKTYDSKYEPFWWRAPPQWTPTLNSKFYGDVIRSAHYIKAGDGSSSAEWRTEIQDTGDYDIYVYLDSENVNRFQRGGQNSNFKYHYTVFSDDGEEEVIIELKGIKSGWNVLGNFYLSKGEVYVKLSNQSESRHVIADAVKWVKR